MPQQFRTYLTAFSIWMATLRGLLKVAEESLYFFRDCNLWWVSGRPRVGWNLGDISFVIIPVREERVLGSSTTSTLQKPFPNFKMWLWTSKQHILIYLFQRIKICMPFVKNKPISSSKFKDIYSLFSCSGFWRNQPLPTLPGMDHS